ncbi:Fe(3+)-hydroxamate ABC transporter permease FhuB [Nisaea acidiphila]|uniref:Fe(3+)-hydroxamate ABC transporter permease FhuB n=1 Tax=Nisaea acidiphila TaxID=1862145 RepID=A0A9J7AXC3_9PROT|nr:Fe(3+)-hydroxamate ABC transporter permease FhuB [Nisaea acidiphila]UUX51081.1 Fe(3+)-hydroxamate ABC transporter permease FhuB [Nisaea acidiphila]
MRPAAIALALLLGSVVLHVAAGYPTGLTLRELIDGTGLQSLLFWSSELPRVAMALLVGAGLGLAGSTMQEITRNPLASPSTLGTIVGAWLALMVATVFWPEFAGRYGVWICLFGGLSVTAVVLTVSGLSRMDGIVVIVVGMATNLFLGGVVLVLALLNGETVQAVFVWVAGDLTQTGWADAQWLAPQIAVGAALILALARPLTILRLGQDAARARGLAVLPLVIVLLSLSVWLTAASIAVVGAIGFIGLIAPNAVRLLGVRSVVPGLLLGALLGAASLTLTDAIPVALTDWSRTLIPSGSAAALIGAPVLVLVAMKQMRPDASSGFQMVWGLEKLPPFAQPALSIAAIAATALAIGFGASPDGAVWIGDQAERLRPMLISLRWPSVIAAAGAGAALATVGVILQRLLRNPLASPDVLGVTAGATFTAVAGVVFLGLPAAETAIPSAAFGAFAVLILLSLLWRRSETPPAMLILAGIALAALLDALIQFAMARAGSEANELLVWRTGATSLATPTGAVTLFVTAAVILALALSFRRWLTLLTFGEGMASARGLGVIRARRTLLVLVAAGAGSVVAWVGPISFIGLLAPHAATMLGARQVGQQLVVATALGTILLVAAEVTGRFVAYPNQLPTGAVASLIGGAYLFGLLLLSLFRRKSI